MSGVEHKTRWAFYGATDEKSPIEEALAKTQFEGRKGIESGMQRVLDGLRDKNIGWPLLVQKKLAHSAKVTRGKSPNFYYVEAYRNSTFYRLYFGNVEGQPVALMFSDDLNTDTKRKETTDAAAALFSQLQAEGKRARIAPAKRVELPDEDIRVDTFKGSGPGGQHRNTTESNVRLTHLPTGITVTVGDERSQSRNKTRAREILEQRVASFEAEQRTAAAAPTERDQPPPQEKPAPTEAKAASAKRARGFAASDAVPEELMLTWHDQREHIEHIKDRMVLLGKENPELLAELQTARDAESQTALRIGVALLRHEPPPAIAQSLGGLNVKNPLSTKKYSVTMVQKNAQRARAAAEIYHFAWIKDVSLDGPAFGRQPRSPKALAAYDAHAGLVLAAQQAGAVTSGIKIGAGLDSRATIVRETISPGSTAKTL